MIASWWKDVDIDAHSLCICTVRVCHTALVCSCYRSGRRTYPKDNAQICLHVDASEKTIGAALYQRVYNQLQQLCFEQRYSTYDRELLAIYRGVEHFQYMLEGRNAIIPITSLWRSPSYNGLEKSQQIHNRHTLRQGHRNHTAAFLSRIESITKE